MFDEDELLPLSALQHLLFCERRAALVHIEGLWAENVATREGAHLHEKAHEPGIESRNSVRIARAVPLRSLRLGLSGKADVIEFHPLGEASVVDGGCTLPGVEGRWCPLPIEYKRGRLRKEEGYAIQLCAQALCLEEALGGTIPGGAIYFGKTRRRLDVTFDDELRRATEEAVWRLHHLINQGVTPRAVREPKCERCSMLNLCLPGGMGPRRSAANYLANLLNAH